MSKKVLFISNGVILALILFFFRNWFSWNILSSGDWIYYFPEKVQDMRPLSSWDWFHNGMGASEMHQLWLNAYFTPTVKLVAFIPWQLYERLFWFFPYLLIGLLASYYAAKKLLGGEQTFLLTSLLYLTNTYALLLVGGGQMGIGLAYALFPLVLTFFWDIVRNLGNREFNLVHKSVIAGVFFAFLVMFDIRVAYVCSLVCLVLIAAYITKHSSFFIHLGIFALITGGITFLLHSFWIVPLLMHSIPVVDSLRDIYTSVDSLSFFSFAKLEETISLLHPNWPENLFGKTYFMRGEFLLIPIIAFTSVLLVNAKVKSQNVKSRLKIQNFNQSKTILLLGLVGLLGVFMGKGVNEPGGQIYAWLFEHLPGFVMFRDPTKFYLLISFSYSLLIPYSLVKVSERVSSIEYRVLSILRSKNVAYGLVVCLFLVFWLFTVRQAVWGEMRGTFTKHEVPREYKELSQFLSSQPDFFRVLWVPKMQRFGMFPSKHPSMSAEELFQAYSIQDLELAMQQTVKTGQLQDYAVKYVIVPFDSQKDLFITDRKFDQQLYERHVQLVQRVPGLVRIEQFGDLVVYEVRNPKTHFWIAGSGIPVGDKKLSQTAYEVSLKDVEKYQRLVFSESYSSNWYARTERGEVIPAEKHFGSIQSFILPEEGSYTLKIQYKPQEDVDRWLGVSGITGLVIILYLSHQWYSLRKRDKIKI